MTNQKGGDLLKYKHGFVYKQNKSWPLMDKSYWTCANRQKFSCPVTIVSSISSQKLISRTGDQRHSNQLIERTVRGVEEEKIKLAAQMPTVSPRTILGDISMTLENRMTGRSSYLRSKHQCGHTQAEVYCQGIC
jgi:hypothetical protein